MEQNVSTKTPFKAEAIQFGFTRLKKQELTLCILWVFLVLWREFSWLSVIFMVQLTSMVVFWYVLAYKGKTHIVEHFLCSRSEQTCDRIWTLNDAAQTELTGSRFYDATTSDSRPQIGHFQTSGTRQVVAEPDSLQIYIFGLAAAWLRSTEKETEDAVADDSTPIYFHRTEKMTFKRRWPHLRRHMDDSECSPVIGPFEYFQPCDWLRLMAAIL